MNRRRLERAANELPVALLAFARENDADVIIAGAELLFFPSGDIVAGWEITIERLGETLAVGYGRTVLDASLVALAKARQVDFVEAESPRPRSEVS